MPMLLRTRSARIYNFIEVQIIIGVQCTPERRVYAQKVLYTQSPGSRSAAISNQ